MAASNLAHQMHRQLAACQISYQRCLAAWQASWERYFTYRYIAVLFWRQGCTQPCYHTSSVAPEWWTTERLERESEWWSWCHVMDTQLITSNMLTVNAAEPASTPASTSFGKQKSHTWPDLSLLLVLSHPISWISVHSKVTPLRLLVYSKASPLTLSLTHFVPQTRIYHFEHNVASARKWETLILDQYFRFGVPSVEVTAPS